MGITSQDSRFKKVVPYAGSFDWRQHTDYGHRPCFLREPVELRSFYHVHICIILTLMKTTADQLWKLPLRLATRYRYPYSLLSLWSHHRGIRVNLLLVNRRYDDNPHSSTSIWSLRISGPRRATSLPSGRRTRINSIWSRLFSGAPFGSGRALMDLITTIKTPNPKCRLYWCLIDFIDWRYIQSCWYFRPLLWISAPLTESLVHLPPPPFPVWISTGVHVFIQCVMGGGGRGERIGGLRQINTCPQVPLLISF